MKKYAYLFLFCLISIAATAQTGIIKGRITTSDQKPAGDVSVYITGLKRAATTDSAGDYILKNIQAGNYTLIVSMIGLETEKKALKITSGETLQVDIVLHENAERLAEVIITARKSANEKTVAFGKSGIDAKDLPQSIVTISKEVLERQQALTISDALMNVNGVYLMGTTGGTQNEIAGRGFAFNSTNTFKNGVRFNNSLMPEVSALQRFEMIKGSAAILYGNVTAGGVMNLVTQKPLFEKGGQVSMRLGSFNFYKPSIDIYGPLADSKNIAYRIVTSYEKSHSFRDFVVSERFYINPSFLINLNNKTNILVEGDYTTDNRTLDNGIGAVNYVIPNLPRNRFLGTPWSYNKAQESSITITTTHQFNSNWQLKNILGFYNYTNDLFGTARPDDGGGAAYSANGNWVRSIQHSGTNEDYYVAQLDLTGKFTTASIKHQLLAGADADFYNTNSTNYNLLAVYDSINIFDLGKYKQRNDIPNMTLNTLTHTPINRFGVYVQDLISLTPNLKVLAGVRFSYQQTTSDVLAYATNLHTISSTFAHPFTPRFGIVYQPTKNISLFTSYSNSFTLNTGIDTSGKALPPSFINQYEAGIKTDWFNKLLSLNITAYQIVNSNLAQTSLANGNTNSNIKELAGEVTSKGLEVDISTRPVYGFNFMAGYSYNDSRYTKSNIFFPNARLQYNPQNTANLSVYYTFSNHTLNGLNLGLIAMYVGDRAAGREPRVTTPNDIRKLMPVPDFTQVDASAGYNFKKATIRLKISNLFNVLSYYAHEDGSVNPIAPTAVALTASFKL